MRNRDKKIISMTCGYQGCGWSLTSENDTWPPGDLYKWYKIHFDMAHPALPLPPKIWPMNATETTALTTNVTFEKDPEPEVKAEEPKPPPGYTPPTIKVPMTEAEWAQWAKDQKRKKREGTP